MADLIADSIRLNQSFAMEKLSSVKLALNERRLQLQQLVSSEKRPRTAFLRTPNHIRALFESVSLTAVELRQQLTVSGSEISRQISPSETSQLSALVSDLERELSAVSKRLDLIYRREVTAVQPELLQSAMKTEGSEMTSCQLPGRLPPLSHKMSQRRTRAMVLRLNATSVQRQDGSNQCYPRGSSFPKLAPIPSRRNFELPKPRDGNCL